MLMENETYQLTVFYFITFLHITKIQEGDLLTNILVFENFAIMKLTNELHEAC